MKRIRNIFCIAIMLISSVFVFACNGNDDPPPSNVNVSFETLKSVVEESKDISGWQGLKLTTLNASNEVVNSFKSTKQVARSSDVVVDFIHEKGNHKIYCDDNVRYYYEEARPYLDESEFNYTEYEKELLSDCLDEVEEFFKNDKNSDNLLNSSKLDKEDNIEYTFEIVLDKSNNKRLVATYICDKHNKLIMIKVVVLSDDNEKLETEITENEEVVVTPEWFESDKYKEGMDYDQVKNIILNENLFKGWKGAEATLPKIISGYDIKQHFWQETDNSTYKYFKEETSEDRERRTYYSNGLEYVYVNGKPFRVNEYDIKSKNLEKDLFEISSMFMQNFFYDGNENGVYYVNSKKYHKDKTIISYKFEYTADNETQLLIGSLHYDIAGNLYLVEAYFAIIAEQTTEINFVLRRTYEEFEMPEWVELEDFGNVVLTKEYEDVLSHGGVDGWKDYCYSAKLYLKDNSYVKDGEYFSETARINITNDYKNYIVDSYVSEEVKELLRDDDPQTPLDESEYYTFWFEKERNNRKLYCINGVEYNYCDDEKTSLTNYTPYSPDFYNSIQVQLLNKFLIGEYIGTFELPVINLTNNYKKLNDNLPLPVDKVFTGWVCSETQGENIVYTQIFHAESNPNAFLKFQLVKNQNDEILKVVIENNILLATNGIVTYTFEKTDSVFAAPDWFNENDF
ncbi:MAG: hypothetical protein E7345_03400 [Clostridiales bacterium]|nr:hypothetical protein [Clostridiales bacterium]